MEFEAFVNTVEEATSKPLNRLCIAWHGGVQDVIARKNVRLSFYYSHATSQGIGIKDIIVSQVVRQ